MFFFVFCRYKQQNFMYLAQLLVQAEATIACFVPHAPEQADNRRHSTGKNHFDTWAVNIYICKSILFKN